MKDILYLQPHPITASSYILNHSYHAKIDMRR
jgi:hypothetical protein